MRVVAGSARGRSLRAPAGSSTRPTADRVREAVFSSLASLGGVDGAAVADLFAGSGALGIEALSRGAAGATFVESDPAAVAAVRANLEALGMTGPAVAVLRADALSVAADPALVGGWDVVFADPPYRFGEWDTLLAGLAGAGFGGLVVAETGAPLDVPAGWDAVRERAYGTTVVTMLRPLRARTAPEAPAVGERR